MDIKIIKIVAIGVIILAVIICVIIGLNHFENYEKIYYSQIDNTNVEELNTTDDLKYEYTLDCYDENGKHKELSFKTYRELREDAYIKLVVRSLGVHTWEEVQYDQLPHKVQGKYS